MGFMADNRMKLVGLRFFGDFFGTENLKCVFILNFEDVFINLGFLDFHKCLQWLAGGRLGDRLHLVPSGHRLLS